MRRLYIVSALLGSAIVAVFLITGVHAGGGKGYRTWQTNDGRKSVVKMAVVQQNDKTVKLKREDNGREFEVPIDRLSFDDQQYLRGLSSRGLKSKSAKTESKSLQADKRPRAVRDSPDPEPSTDRTSPQIARSSSGRGDLRSNRSAELDTPNTTRRISDWPQFLGPLRNGVQPDPTPLVDSLDDDLSPVWTSERIPSDKQGGFGSPAVANGRVFVYCSWKSSGGVEDVTLCLDANSGRTIWKKSYASGAGKYGSSCTPCVVNGKVYVTGGRGTSYCFDADSGRENWKTTVHSAEINSSFAYLDGRVFVLADRLVALDAKTGEKLWEQRQVSGGRNSSPIVWTHGNESYIVAGNNGICCVKTDDGEVVWRVRGTGQPGSPVACGRAMVDVHNNSARLFEISKSGATMTTEFTEGKSSGSTPVNDGRRIWCSGHRVACIDAGSGEVKWSQSGVGASYACPILADGKLLSLGHRGYVTMFDADSGRNLGRAGVKAVRCSSPALAAGQLYVRTLDDVRCYDLRK